MTRNRSVPIPVFRTRFTVGSFSGLCYHIPSTYIDWFTIAPAPHDDIRFNPAPTRRYYGPATTPSPWSPSSSNYALNVAHYNSFQHLGPPGWERSDSFGGDEHLPGTLYQPQYIPLEFMHPIPLLDPTSPRYSLATDFQRFGSTTYQSNPIDLDSPISPYDESPAVPRHNPFRSPSPSNFDDESDSASMGSTAPRIAVQSPSLEYSSTQDPTAGLADNVYYPEGPISSFNRSPRSSPFTPGSTPWVPPPGYIPQTFEPSPLVFVPSDINSGTHTRLINCSV